MSRSICTHAPSREKYNIRVNRAPVLERQPRLREPLDHAVVLQLDLSVLVLGCDFDRAVIACKLGVSLMQSRMIKVALPFRTSVPMMIEVGG